MRQHGFDDWCLWTGFEGGNPPSAKRYWDPYINTPKGSKTCEGKFGPDVYTDFLIDFAKRHRAEPMFLYFPMCLTHGPLVHTPDEPDVKQPLDKHKAMVRYVDTLVGRLVDAIERLGIRERTIIIFTTDNGTSGGLGGTRNGRKVKGGKGKKVEAGCCAPFIVNGPTRVPAGVKTDALTDFTDLLPTFIELAGGSVPQGTVVDGVSIAPLLQGKAEDSPRQWIMALGHGPARLDERGVRGQYDYASRVIRDKRYKVWVDTDGKIERLHDLQADPWEQTNLIDSDRPAHVTAKKRFQQVIDSLPAKDGRPKYRPRPGRPWEKRP